MDGYLESYANAAITEMTADSHLLSLMAGASTNVRLANLLVGKSSYNIAISEETWIDMGGEPPPGYWRRQEESAIRRGAFRVQLRVAWLRLTAEPRARLAHALSALSGYRCYDD